MARRSSVWLKRGSYKPREWRSSPSIATISGFGIVPSFRSIIVRLIVLNIPVTTEGKSNPASFHLPIK